MKKKATFTIMFFAASLMAGGAFAAEGRYGEQRGAAERDRAPAVGMQQQQQQQQQQLVSADDLTNFNVMDAQGEQIGQISQVLIDIESGRVGYAIVGGNGILGIGEDEYIVPFAALSRGMEEETLTVDVQRDQLREAPEDVEQITRQQEQEIHQFYGVSPYWEENGAMQRDQLQQDQPFQQRQQDQQFQQRQQDQPFQQERQQQQQQQTPGTGTGAQ